MLLTISTTYQPATDLGYLLHKNPVRLQSFTLNFGQAHVFYPEASLDRCTAALLLDVDTIELVRGKGKTVSLDQYVNDRPYVASSFLSVAIANIFSSALNGRCTQCPELVTTPMPLQAQLAAIPFTVGADLSRTWPIYRPSGLFRYPGYFVKTHFETPPPESGHV